MPWIEWYTALAKPTWTPSPSTIGLIWSILYPVIAISFAVAETMVRFVPG